MGGSVKRNGVLNELKAALDGYAITEVFGGIEPNPEYETLIKGVNLVRDKKVDFLLALGGGSVIDGTKFIAVAVPYQREPWDIIKTFGGCICSALPFGTAVTLPASGSEMNSGAMITRRSLKAKLPFASPLLFPKFSVLDPTKTYTLPADQSSKWENGKM